MDITELQRLEPGKRINRHPWEITRARIIAFFLSKYQPHSKHIADFGSGDAFVLSTIAGKEFADRYSAIDTAYTPEIIQLVKTFETNPSISFLTDIYLMKKTEEKADCFLLLDVLEHCEDDAAVLGPLVKSEMATDNALFLVTVPAFRSLFSEHDKLLHHYRRYTRKQLATLCQRSSLEVLASGYFFSILVPVRWFQLVLEKMKLRKPTTSLDSWKGNKVITRLFYAILWADFRVGHLFTKIGIRFPGLSCYCICRKLPS